MPRYKNGAAHLHGAVWRCSGCFSVCPGTLVQGKCDDLLFKLARCANRGNNKNACRNLTKLIKREGLVVPVELEFVEVTCRRRKPKVEDIQIQWPVLSMKSWARFLWTEHPKLLLGGHDRCGDWRGMLAMFWSKWRAYQPQRAVFDSEVPLEHCIPYYTHGDEGQTLRKVPFLVESWQPAISWKGIQYTTMSGCLGCEAPRTFACLFRPSFCSRLLFTCMSASCFSGDRTMQQLSDAWVAQMLELWADGVEARLMPRHRNHTNFRAR